MSLFCYMENSQICLASPLGVTLIRGNITGTLFPTTGRIFFVGSRRIDLCIEQHAGHFTVELWWYSLIEPQAKTQECSGSKTNQHTHWYIDTTYAQRRCQQTDATNSSPCMHPPPRYGKIMPSSKRKKLQNEPGGWERSHLLLALAIWQLTTHASL